MYLYSMMLKKHINAHRLSCRDAATIVIRLQMYLEVEESARQYIGNTTPTENLDLTQQRVS